MEKPCNDEKSCNNEIVVTKDSTPTDQSDDTSSDKPNDCEKNVDSLEEGEIDDKSNEPIIDPKQPRHEFNIASEIAIAKCEKTILENGLPKGVKVEHVSIEKSKSAAVTQHEIESNETKVISNSHNEMPRNDIEIKTENDGEKENIGMSSGNIERSKDQVIKEEPSEKEIDLYALNLSNDCNPVDLSMDAAIFAAVEKIEERAVIKEENGDKIDRLTPEELTENIEVGEQIKIELGNIPQNHGEPGDKSTQIDKGTQLTDAAESDKAALNTSGNRSVNISTHSKDYLIVEDENNETNIYVTRKKRKKKKTPA